MARLLPMIGLLGLTAACSLQEAPDEVGGCVLTSGPLAVQPVPNFSDARVEPAPSAHTPTVSVEQAITTARPAILRGASTSQSIEARLVVLIASSETLLAWEVVLHLAEPYPFHGSGPPGRPPEPPCMIEQTSVFVDATAPRETFLFAKTYADRAAE